MRSSTRSLLIAFGTAAAVAVVPLALDQGGQASDEHAVAVVDTTPTLSKVTDVSAGSSAVPAGDVQEPVAGDTAVAPSPASGPTTSPGTTGSAMGGDLAPELLPLPPYPQCPVTDAGAWWTDPADPYTCLPPGSVPFHEPTPPGIDPELLEPIFEEPGTPPGPGDDCRTIGALQCTVTIMGQEYVVTFSDGKPVGVMEARQ